MADSLVKYFLPSNSLGIYPAILGYVSCMQANSEFQVFIYYS